MEIILRDHVEHLGSRGQIVKVADGYARNYLLPRKLALVATEANKKRVERERKIAEAREAEDRAASEAIASRLAALDLDLHPPGGRHRAAVRLGDQPGHRRRAEGQGLRASIGARSCSPTPSRRWASSPCRSSCTAT